jgi:hypothetical protein
MLVVESGREKIGHPGLIRTGLKEIRPPESKQKIYFLGWLLGLVVDLILDFILIAFMLLLP